ncbi:hypothetical protein [Clostridium sp.]|uniref:hypothetical protein n=1 Tax=Clostridium sp. TaxID=1506 RepID=UPI002914FDA8|nr:hypothetical protein [Clostridium sp.]MDU3406667.1 hypothetical protein [Clostridium sp.]
MGDKEREVLNYLYERIIIRNTSYEYKSELTNYSEKMYEQYKFINLFISKGYINNKNNEKFYTQVGFRSDREPNINDISYNKLMFTKEGIKEVEKLRKTKKEKVKDYCKYLGEKIIKQIEDKVIAFFIVFITGASFGAFIKEIWNYIMQLIK